LGDTGLRRMWLGRLLLISLAVGAAAGCARQPVQPYYAQTGYPVAAPIAAAPLPQVIPPSQVARVPVPVPRPVGTVQVAQYPPSVPIAQPQYAPAVLPEQPYTLGSGDRLRIVVFGQEGLTNLYAVDANGNITMPLIGLVPAQGATTHQLAGAISARLRQGFIREPSVAVEIEIYRPFFILGEVVFPGQYPYVANMTAETAVAIAGGFTPRAKKAMVDLTRPFKPQALRATVPLHTPVRPGDTIYVAERWF
jgi:polysaccharide export outer membrane protein